MSGIAITRYLLANNSALTAQVPASRIKAGVLPRGTQMPAIAVTKISGNQSGNLAMNASSYLMTDRVQVTVLSEAIPTLHNIIELVRDALPLSRGDVNGDTCEGIVPDTEGPDLFDQDFRVYTQSLDFMVSWIRQVD